MRYHPAVLNHIGAVLVVLASPHPGFAQASNEGGRIDDFAVTLESVFAQLPRAEFSTIRETRDLPPGVLDAIARGLPMAEWGEPHNTGDLIGDTPISRHIISWKSSGLVVVAFLLQESTVLFLGDLEQRRGCEYFLGPGYPATITLVSLKELLRSDFAGQPQVSCIPVDKF